MLKFVTGAFAVGGLIAATGPIIIHLLNRRRFKVVEWAAMNFLRQAMQRNRRVLNLRDLIVLVLRCLTVAVFGVALARPFVSGFSTWMILGAIVTALATVTAIGAAAASILSSQPSVRRNGWLTCGASVVVTLVGLAAMLFQGGSAGAAALSGKQPVHAIVLLDNSMSMAYQGLDKTLLDEARAKAAEFIDALPAGSQIHVIPLCGSDDATATTAYRNKTDARAALDRVTVVDRIGRASHGLQLASDASQQVPELPTKRVVLISDQQEAVWSGGAAKSQLAEIGDVQLLRIPVEKIENVWVSDFRLQDGIADTETPAVFLATVRHAGDQPMTNLRVALSINGEEVASRLVDLEPGQAREVEFKQRLDAADTSGLAQGVEAAAFLKATVSITAEGGVGDRLVRDNQRHVVVPLVTGLPVVFVDQYGQEENLDRNEIGETIRIRRLLAPRSSTDEEENRQLIRVRHLMIERLNEETLSDARLVVIAGVSSPGESSRVLRQYIEQGGTVLIAAGADFEPHAWSQAAWDNGNGILPVPLAIEPVGQLPELANDKLETFTLDTRSMQHDFFLIEGETPDALDDLYRGPIFFKAAVADVSEATLDASVKSLQQRIVEQREFLKQSDERRKVWDDKERQGTFSEADASERRVDDDRRTDAAPTWLKWQDSDAILKLAELSPEELATQSRPRVLARYAPNGHPFLVERRVGAGRVYFLSSGLYSSWNTLTSTNAILMFDRMLRQRLEQSLPRRNFETGEIVSLPAQKSDRLRWEVASPDDRKETLTVEALSANRYGVLLRRALQQGHYSVTGSDASEATAVVKSTIPLAFNCPSEESDLAAFDAISFRDRMGEGSYRWLERDSALSVEGAQVRGRDLWKWAIIGVFLFLLTEMLILAWPYRRAEELASAT